MTQETSTIDKNIKKAKDLLQQGYIAYNNWEIKKARLLWRKAAVVDPANEEIWLALYNVTQDDEDRKACLQNILILNPDNKDAEQRLRLMENDTQPADIPPVIEPKSERVSPIMSDKIQRILSWVLTGIVLIVASIVIFSMLIQPLV